MGKGRAMGGEGGPQAKPSSGRFRRAEPAGPGGAGAACGPGLRLAGAGGGGCRRGAGEAHGRPGKGKAGGPCPRMAQRPGMGFCGGNGRIGKLKECLLPFTVKMCYNISLGNFPKK